MGTRLSWLASEPEPEPEPEPPVDPRVERERRFREYQAELRRARVARDQVAAALRRYVRVRRWYQLGLAVGVALLALALLDTTVELGVNPVGAWVVGAVATVGFLLGVSIHYDSSLVDCTTKIVDGNGGTRTATFQRTLAEQLAEAEADYEVAVVGTYLAEE